MSIPVIPMGFFEGVFFTNVNFFLILMIALTGGFIGATSGYASIGGFGAFIIFIHVATQVDLWIFKGLLYVILVILFIFMAAQTWGLFTSSSGEM